jgi:hypothetical protein
MLILKTCVPQVAPGGPRSGGPRSGGPRSGGPRSHCVMSRRHTHSNRMAAAVRAAGAGMSLQQQWTVAVEPRCLLPRYPQDGAVSLREVLPLRQRPRRAGGVAPVAVRGAVARGAAAAAACGGGAAAARPAEAVRGGQAGGAAAAGGRQCVGLLCVLALCCCHRVPPWHELTCATAMGHTAGAGLLSLVTEPGH